MNTAQMIITLKLTGITSILWIFSACNLKKLKPHHSDTVRHFWTMSYLLLTIALIAEGIIAIMAL